jgi:hypothetical protein
MSFKFVYVFLTVFHIQLLVVGMFVLNHPVYLLCTVFLLVAYFSKNLLKINN